MLVTISLTVFFPPANPPFPVCDDFEPSGEQIRHDCPAGLHRLLLHHPQGEAQRDHAAQHRAEPRRLLQLDAQARRIPKIITCAFLAHRQEERSAVYKAGIASEWALAYSTGERACICAIAHFVFVQMTRCICAIRWPLCVHMRVLQIHFYAHFARPHVLTQWQLYLTPRPKTPCELWKFWPSLKIY